MNQPELGNLDKVDLRDAWKSEDGDFTPWLARDENLALLGDTIGIELELEATEKDVGPFRADILCKDTRTGHWVLVENQLARTDHTHLGQLLTYAAGLNAVTIVWIASPFTDEHRSTLDWLNDITDDRFNFFGLEIELWRIGDSPAAAKFNVVSKPNDWSRSVSRAASAISEEALTEGQRLQLEFWTEFRKYIEMHPSRIKPTKPSPNYWMSFAIGRSYFTLYGNATMRDGGIGVHLAILGPHAKPHFYLLRQDKEAIEKELGHKLQWRELPDNKESQILLRWEEADATNKADWADYHHWLRDTLDRFHEVLGPRVKRLEASQWETETILGAEANAS